MRELKTRKAMPSPHWPTATAREVRGQSACSKGSPGSVRRALIKVLGLAESFGRGQTSETRSDRSPHFDAHPLRAPKPSSDKRRLSLALQGGAPGTRVSTRSAGFRHQLTTLSAVAQQT